METLYLLIPVSVILVFAIGVAFWFSLRGGQFEDMEGPAYRVVMDDDRVPTEVKPPRTPSGGGGVSSEFPEACTASAQGAPSAEKQKKV